MDEVRDLEPTPTATPTPEPTPAQDANARMIAAYEGKDIRGGTRDAVSADRDNSRYVPEPRQPEPEQAAETEPPEGEAPESEPPAEEPEPDPLKAIMERFKLGDEDLADPRVKAMVEAMLEKAESEEGENEEAETEQAEEAQQPEAPKTREEAYQQHFEGLAKLANDPTINDPVMVGIFKNELAQAYGATTPEEIQNVDRLSNTLIQGGLSLMSSVFPRMMQAQFGQYLEAALPGITEMVQDATLYNSWESTKASNPDFADLPSWGTPELEARYAEVVKKNPWAAELQFPNKSFRESVAAKGLIFAKLMAGEKLSPESIKQAVETGRKQERDAQRRVASSKSLGAGKSRGSFGTGRDNFGKSLIDAYNSRHGIGNVIDVQEKADTSAHPFMSSHNRGRGGF